MNARKALSVLTAALVLAAWPGCALGAVEFYQDQASWEAAAAAAGLSTALETFDGFADTSDGSIPDFSIGAVTFEDNNVGPLGLGGISGGALFTSGGAASFESGNVTVQPGHELRGMAFDHPLSTEQIVSLEIYLIDKAFFDEDEPELFDGNIDEVTGSTFIGFIVDPGEMAFEQLYVNPEDDFWATFDNMRIAFSEPPAVPASSPPWRSVLFLALATLLAIGVAVRYRGPA